MSMMVLGDALEDVGRFLMSEYSEETLKCDIVQIANHSYDGVSNDLYDVIDADICVVPNSYGKYMERYIDTELLGIYPDLMPIIDASEAYFAGKFEFTVGFAVVDGKVTVSSKHACEGECEEHYTKHENCI